MTAQLSDALMRCHHNGLYHKDLKPQNILVCRGSSHEPGSLSNGLVLKITDFGSSPVPFQSQDSFGFLGRMVAEKERDSFTAPGECSI
jgi:serine/threonine protein kinase